MKNWVSTLKDKIIPPLLASAHKGAAGRVCVIGGSYEYSGAPFYSALSALKTGCDLSFIMCSESSGTAIKSYSPEIIVYPNLVESNVSYHKDDTTEKFEIEFLHKIHDIIPRLHVIVIGPGLSRNSSILKCAKIVIQEASKQNLPIVVDGDGLFLVTKEPSVVKGNNKAILTPNPVEFLRLCSAIGLDVDENKLKEDESYEQQTAEKLSQYFGNCIIVKKGARDIITNGKDTVICTVDNPSPRRCGGQGDILSGALGTFVHWANQAVGNKDNQFSSEQEKDQQFLIACGGACLLTKTAAKLAFAKHYRATTSPDIIEKLGEAFHSLYDSKQ